jgi:hypothetical protein
MIHASFTEMRHSILSGLFEERQRFFKLKLKKLQDSNIVQGSSNISLVIILFLLLALFHCFLESFSVNADNFFVKFERSFDLVVLECNIM